MKRFLNSIAIVFVIIAALLLLLALFLPLQMEPAATAAAIESTQEMPGKAQDIPALLVKLPEQEHIASLFGWVRPVSVRTPVIPKEKSEPEPGPAIWLSFIGEITTEGEEKVYYLKNTRNGKVFTIGLTPGNEAGWNILEDRENELLIENEGAHYIIPKR